MLKYKKKIGALLVVARSYMPTSAWGSRDVDFGVVTQFPFLRAFSLLEAIANRLEVKTTSTTSTFSPRKSTKAEHAERAGYAAAAASERAAVWEFRVKDGFKAFDATCGLAQSFDALNSNCLDCRMENEE